MTISSSIIIYQPNNLPSVLSGTNILPVLSGINLAICVDDVFAWLKLKKI